MNFLFICEWFTHWGNLSVFREQSCWDCSARSAEKSEQINMCLDKPSEAMLASSEKCRKWLIYSTELQQRIAKLTPAVIWLFWIQLLVFLLQRPIYHLLSLHCLKTLISTFISVVPKLNSNLLVRLFGDITSSLYLWGIPSPDHRHSTTGTHNHCTLLKWDKTKADNTDFTDIWIQREVQNQIHKST